MKTALKTLLASLVLLLVTAVGGYAWARDKTATVLDRIVETHEASFPIPFPLTPEELSELEVTDERAEALALERAVERGRHLVEARYGCADCHGPDFGGGVMVDDAAIGTILGPNLTYGDGGLAEPYTPEDWDRIVRHGVKRDGRPSMMPSQDYLRMSDEELSDIVAYIRSLPPVDSSPRSIRLGLVGTILVATGKLPLPADLIADHGRAHRMRPPDARPDAEFGEHLAGVCMGCHGESLQGGPVPGGDPAWPPATNLTPHADGLRYWTYEEFASLLREGRRRDGSRIGEPMSSVSAYGRAMSETELRALWTYLRSIPPLPQSD